MLKKHKYTLLWGIWTIAIITLSLISSSEMPKAPRIPYLDKIAHFSFYFGYTALFILAFRSKLWAVITTLFLGATMEILQGLLTTTRSADFIDMLFNTFGTVVALLFMRKYEKLFR